MFQLLPCSRCQRTQSVRSEVSDQALLKCPNCGNQFRLGELLDAFYAPWEILENPGVATPATTAGTGQSAAAAASALSPAAPASASAPVQQESDFVGAVASDDGDRGLSLDGPDLELAEDAEEVSTGISLAGKDKQETDWSQYKPITHEEFQRIKRADRSPIWSTLQVVLGGAAAIPVSLLLIWYVLDKDVAGAGPTIARYVPWIVPEKFRGAEQPEPAASPSEPGRTPRRGESGFRNFDDVMPTAEDAAQSSDSATPEETPADEAGAVVATLAEDGAEPAVADDESMESPLQPASPDVAPTEANDAADPPMADVFALLQRIDQEVDQWREVATAEDAVKKEAALALFEDLARLGAFFSTVSDMPGAPALARDKAQEICRAIKRQPDLVQVLYSAAKAQLSGILPRSKNGWVLVCTVGETQELEEAWRIMVADEGLLPLDVPTIEVPKNVAPQLTGGQRLLLLGSFITPPSAATEVSATEDSEDAAPAPEIFRASFSYGL